MTSEGSEAERRALPVQLTLDVRVGLIRSIFLRMGRMEEAVDRIVVDIII